ncbi:MAG: hypothetical protein JW820_15530 [Spirochaetales bacterium]|nr:hypothetical protein [Spirochaetales bacterium]
MPGAKPILNVLQRHYPTMSSPPVVDALLLLDLPTALPSGGHDQVKPQPLWLRTAWEVLAKRQRANRQVGAVAFLPYGSKLVQSPALMGLAVTAWLACDAGLEVVLGQE